jgi:hypothetical protein
VLGLDRFHCILNCYKNLSICRNCNDKARTEYSPYQPVLPPLCNVL